MLGSIHSFTSQYQASQGFRSLNSNLQQPLAGQTQRAPVGLSPTQSSKALEGPSAVTSAPVTADRAAGNILLFIENQLKVDVANGDSKAQLQSRFDAGLKGFLQGFNEAKEQLSEMGLLSDALADDIGATYDKVMQGLGQLAEELGLDTSAIPTPTTPTEKPAQVDRFGVGNIQRQAGVVKAQKSFDFTVQTQEGDKVTISASSRFAAKGVESAQGSSLRVNQSQQFDLTINGDLNADEIAAINDLLSQVNDLSEQFFNGDLDAAFEAALDLGFDAEEIASFAVDLKYSVTQKVRTTYGQGANETSPLRAPMQPFSQLADQVQSALESAKQFLNSNELLNSLLAERLEADQELKDVKGSMGNLHKLFGDVNHAMAEKLATA
ncbi:DUF5610 domain-containing protein [Simiduia curdlanivorans]|uniref:DUF5610 domain-containing protein n=1 Tax=Simiduia curdlanivorans TaxID=1492769 RepID=A0ABV8V8W4_9GAMM|nr:DUF5610 domain-containing protein [Simiduia curdlanivorans]MDN3639554.1 DUF5610 domain-containing protein [Simiduia curdlanivorans]